MEMFSVEEGLMSLQTSGAAFSPLQEFYLGSSLGDLCRLSGGYAHSGSAPPPASSGPAHSGLVLPAEATLSAAWEWPNSPLALSSLPQGDINDCLPGHC